MTRLLHGEYDVIIARLRSMANEENVAGMARFGINPDNTLGVSMAELRLMATEIGRDHVLAGRLWDCGIHEAKILASLVEEAKMVTGAQMEEWVSRFDSWDVCDQCCLNLFRKTPWAYKKAVQWTERPEEFVKRAGFVLMATLAVHDKKADDGVFAGFLPIIVREATDGRNFVRKAVNWALRQIGKRNRECNRAAIESAEEILALGQGSARWIARDALRELRSERVRERLHD